ncbi:hypothetical protein KUF71_020348 [Frankliniella fusca]|uniref:Uncharacterized protein n=1 Tax=Frankliniella fusca TaxID=407009 RepID=A0AAE1L9A9_9NEOP|nr:hypothetical protein KUF71_020348 [Frankliniella fusca]
MKFHDHFITEGSPTPILPRTRDYITSILPYITLYYPIIPYIAVYYCILPYITVCYTVYYFYITNNLLHHFPYCNVV